MLNGSDCSAVSTLKDEPGAEEIEYYEDEDEVGGVQAANCPEP